MGGVELQTSSGSDTADLAVLHPFVQGLRMTVEEGGGLICSEEVPDFEGTRLHEFQY